MFPSDSTNSNRAWLVYYTGGMNTGDVVGYGAGVRPVITVSKSNLS